MEIRILRRQGMSLRDIARETGVAVNGGRELPTIVDCKEDGDAGFRP